VGVLRRSVASCGVLQFSGRPVLEARPVFIIFISDLDDGIVNKILKFADDTEIESKVASEDHIKILKSDLHKMFSWSQDWLMLFILRFFGDSWPWVATRYCQDWSVVRWSWSSWNVWHSGTNEWKDETSQMPGELSNQQLCEDRSTCKNQYKKTRRIKVKSHILVSITRQ